MKVENKEKGTYVQPICKLIKMESAQLICTSEMSSQNDEPDDFGYGGSLKKNVDYEEDHQDGSNPAHPLYRM